MCTFYSVHYCSLRCNRLHSNKTCVILMWTVMNEQSGERVKASGVFTSLLADHVLRTTYLIAATQTP